MRHPRITTRWLMEAVAVVAILLTAGIVGRRWLDFSARARSHAAQAWGFSLEACNSYELAYDDIRSGNGAASARQFAEEGAVWRQRALYHDALRRKYEAALWRPWLPVPPDPRRRSERWAVCLTVPRLRCWGRIGSGVAHR